MSVELKELVPGAIAVDFKGGLAIITGLNPRSAKYPVLYKLRTGTRGYKGKPEDFKAVLGKVDLAKYEEVDGAKAPAAAKADVPDVLKPEALKGVKVGDTIEVRHGATVRKVTYEGYKPNRPKYPLTYSLPTGGRYKAAIGALVEKAGAVA